MRTFGPKGAQDAFLAAGVATDGALHRVISRCGLAKKNYELAIASIQLA